MAQVSKDDIPYDYGCIELSAGDLTLNPTAIDYGHDVEVGDIQGTGRVPTAHTPGMYKPAAGSLTLYLSDLMRLQKQLGNGWMKKEVEITVTLSFPGKPVAKDVLQQVRITGTKKSWKKSADGLEVTVPLKPLMIIEDGIHPMNDTQVP